MSPEKGAADESGKEEYRRRVVRQAEDREIQMSGASRWGALYPLAALAQTTVAAALLIAALVVDGGSAPTEGAAIVEAATRLALAIVFVAVYVPATTTLLQWHAERREARRLVNEARQDVEGILRTHRHL